MHSVADPCRVSKRVGQGVCESEVFHPFWVPEYCHLKTMSKKEMARAFSKSATGYPKPAIRAVADPEIPKGGGALERSPPPEIAKKSHILGLKYPEFYKH